MNRITIAIILALSLAPGLTPARGQASQPSGPSSASAQRPANTPQGFGNNRQYRNGNGYGNGGNNFNGGNNLDQRGNRRERRMYGQDGNNGGAFTFPAPTTQSDETPSPPPISGDFLVLMQRSIFSTQRLIQPDQQPSGPPPSMPADTLVFVGVFEPVLADKTAASKAPQPLVAFLEDSDSGATAPVKVGDVVAGGKVVGISLDQMDFQLHGVVEHLVVGQNLAGAQVWGASADSSAALPSTMDFSGPSGDVLKAMALRRQKELSSGGK